VNQPFSFCRYHLLRQQDVAKWMLIKEKGRFARKNPLVENGVIPNSHILALLEESSQSSGLTFGGDRKEHFLGRK
jgi:hypothetical protein